MVLGPDGSKVNLGLSLKFEAKGMKVMEYSRKDGRTWEFSDKALALIRSYKTMFPEVFQRLDNRGDGMCDSYFAFEVLTISSLLDFPRAADVFQGTDPDMRLREAKAWLAKQGIKDFDPVPLSSDQLSKVILHLAPLSDC